MYAEKKTKLDEKKFQTSSIQNHVVRVNDL